MKDENCIFCKLANGDIPTYTLYEDDDFKVIRHYYLGDQEAIAAKMQAVANQGKKQ